MSACGQGCGAWVELPGKPAPDDTVLVAILELMEKATIPTETRNQAAPTCPTCRVRMVRRGQRSGHLPHALCPQCAACWVDRASVAVVEPDTARTTMSEVSDAGVDLAAVLRRVNAVAKETNASWHEESFWRWCWKRLLLTGLRGKS